MKNLFFALLSFVFLTSCGNDDNADNCVSFSESYVDSVELLETADAIGFPYKVKFIVMNGCGGFGSFEETVAGNTVTVNVIAKYEGCVCTEAIEVKEAVYSFNPTAPGTYTLRFRNTEDTFITKTITVE